MSEQRHSLRPNAWAFEMTEHIDEPYRRYERGILRLDELQAAVARAIEKQVVKLLAGINPAAVPRLVGALKMARAEFAAASTMGRWTMVIESIDAALAAAKPKGGVP